jgi:hypothetical protein
MRGRLIQKFVCVLRRLDPLATSEVTDGGYDEEFGEAIQVDNDTELGESSRREQTAIRLKCQLDRDQDFNHFAMTRGGQQETGRIVLLLHMPELESKGLITSEGKPAIFPGDRIQAIETIKGTEVLSFTEPEMFVLTAEPQGYGLNMFKEPKINLIELVCSPKQESQSV